MSQILPCGNETTEASENAEQSQAVLQPEKLRRSGKTLTKSRQQSIARSRRARLCHEDKLAWPVHTAGQLYTIMGNQMVNLDLKAAPQSEEELELAAEEEELDELDELSSHCSPAADTSSLASLGSLATDTAAAALDLAFDLALAFGAF